MVEGLSIGYAMGTVQEAATIENDESTLWVTYASGPFTVGYQTSEVDGQTTTQDDEGTAFGISYAVNDDISVSLNSSETQVENGTDQEAFGISASMVVGSMTISANHNSIENTGGTAGNDLSGYNLNLAFAF